MNKTHKHQNSSGLTVVELIVAMLIASLMGAVLVAVIVSWTQQFGVASLRQDLNTNAQAAISRINDDIRNSDGISLYNTNPDPNAPQSLSGSYANVPGPTDASAQNYYWRFGPNRLILTQPARDSGGNPLYNNPTLFQGPKNIVIYYVKNGTLYRRLIAGTGNAVATTTCSPADALGGCAGTNPSDTKVIGNLSSSDGTNSFNVSYLGSDGNAISVGATGNPASDYSNFAATRMISISVVQSKAQSGVTVIENKGAKIAFRTAPAKQIAATPFFSNSITAGPGGVNGVWNSTIDGLNVSTEGGVSATFSSKIGSPQKPVLVTAVNKGCGTGNNYGTVVCSGEPMKYDYDGHMYGNICGNGQSSSTNSTSGTLEPGVSGTQYTRGLIPYCNPPDITLPSFNKAAHVASMSASKSGASANCDGLLGPSTSTMDANTTYNGDISLSQNCKSTLNGNIYLKGNLTIAFGAQLVVGESVTTRPIVVVNGTVKLFWNATVQPNSKGIAPMFISFQSSNSYCTNNDSCAAITPAGNCPNSSTCSSISNSDLASSVGIDGILVQFGATAPLSLFYSYFSAVTITQTGTVKAGALAGQTINFSYGSQIILDQ